MKFDKHKCAKCVYRGRINSYGYFCNYASVTQRTCLRRDEHGNVYDARGEDQDNCMLFQKGIPLRESHQFQFVKGVDTWDG